MWVKNIFNKTVGLNSGLDTSTAVLKKLYVKRRINKRHCYNV